ASDCGVHSEPGARAGLQAATQATVAVRIVFVNASQLAARFFTTEHLTPPHMEVFQHDVCRLRYQVDVFWVTGAVAKEHVEAMLSVFSRNREGASQPIIEVTL
ncbi:MAG: hypothetical protein AB7G75_34970, partial [Candidatus Binatia bacterium]